jgi:hypothetical protein
MGHRASMAFIRAPALNNARDKIVVRVLLDLQTARALLQIQMMLPSVSGELQQAIHALQGKLTAYLSRRLSFVEQSPPVFGDIRRLLQQMNQDARSVAAMRLIGLMKNMARGLGMEGV